MRELDVLESDTLAVSVDTVFPRIVRYVSKTVDASMDAQFHPATTIELNGETTEYDLAFRRNSPSAATYQIVFPEEEIRFELNVMVANDHVTILMKNIEEFGRVLLANVSFPGNSLLAMDSSDSNAALATTFFNEDREPGEAPEERETIGPLRDIPPMEDTANYFFISNGKLAAGLTSNHFASSQRAAFKVERKGNLKRCEAWIPSLPYREISAETLLLPEVKIFITPDVNGDGRADWQDAAIIHRRHMPKPFGSELVRRCAAWNIAMNFASCAQQPFLRILDHVKRIHLHTDGLENAILLKGHTAEGHDSANTDYDGHYNERAGGLDDLSLLLEKAKNHNCEIGVHVNATEVYPEAHRYVPRILARGADGAPVKAWRWLDQSYKIDKRNDIIEGGILSSLTKMREELSNLNFIYIDTYCASGWPAWKLAERLGQLKLPIFTEMSRDFDPWSVWSHRRFANRVARFIWHSERDLFENDSILRGGREDGFMGWSDQFDFNRFIRATFTNSLPATYLRNFELTRWREGEEAMFTGGMRVSRAGEEVVVRKDGREIMAWLEDGQLSRLFIPWPPRDESKIYVWNEREKKSSWRLPASWGARDSVCLYRLTDRGRRRETRLSVKDGLVDLTIDEATPYVIYPFAKGESGDLEWGEGMLVKDPGFNGVGLKDWRLASSSGKTDHIRSENDPNGCRRLVVSGNQGTDAEISQVLHGLTPGRTYAVSVWARVRGRRKASLTVTPLTNGHRRSHSNYVLKTDVKHGMPNDPRTGTNFQRLKVLFDMPSDCSEASLSLKAARGDNATSVEFADVRVVQTERSPQSRAHWFFEDFEHVDMGYGPFTCCFNDRTHLSEANPPHTDDTINGRYSLKIQNDNEFPERPVLRTLPSTIRFKPWTHYQLTCETLTSEGVEGELRVISAGEVVAVGAFPLGRGRVAFEFTTKGDDDTYIALFKTNGEWMAIDDLAIDELQQ